MWVLQEPTCFGQFTKNGGPRSAALMTCGYHFFRKIILKNCAQGWWKRGDWWCREMLQDRLPGNLEDTIPGLCCLLTIQFQKRNSFRDIFSPIPSYCCHYIRHNTIQITSSLDKRRYLCYKHTIRPLKIVCSRRESDIILFLVVCDIKTHQFTLENKNQLDKKVCKYR